EAKGWGSSGSRGSTGSHLRGSTGSHLRVHGGHGVTPSIGGVHGVHGVTPSIGAIAEGLTQHETHPKVKSKIQAVECKAARGRRTVEPVRCKDVRGESERFEAVKQSIVLTSGIAGDADHQY